MMCCYGKKGRYERFARACLLIIIVLSDEIEKFERLLYYARIDTPLLVHANIVKRN